MPGVAVDGNDVLAVWTAMREAVRPRAARRRADADRGQDLPHRRPPRGRSGDRHLPHAGGGRRLGRSATRSTCSAGASSRTSAPRPPTSWPRSRRGSRPSSRRRSPSRAPRPSPIPRPCAATSTPTRSTRPKRCARRRPARPRTQGWLEAVRDGIAEEMRANPAILYFGEGTGERGGSFAHTKDLWQEFGAERMVDTPISEQGFTSAAVGASATGARTVVRPDVRRLRLRDGRPDLPPGGEAALHEQRRR